MKHMHETTDLQKRHTSFQVITVGSASMAKGLAAKSTTEGKFILDGLTLQSGFSAINVREIFLQVVGPWSYGFMYCAQFGNAF